MNIEILRGYSGSGKSRYVQRRVSQDPSIRNVVVCSADNYFLNREGDYVFDGSKLREAHAKCLRDFIDAVSMLRHMNDLVMVDNSNTTLVELAPYVAIASAFGHRCKIVTICCDVALAHQRNVHKVPLSTIENQARRFETHLPRNWWVTESTIR